MTTREHKSWFDMGDLIQELKQLYKLISQHLWHRRMSEAKPGEARQSAEIHASLSEHVDIDAGDRNTREEGAETVGPLGPQEQPVARKSAEKGPRLGLFKALSQHFSRRRRAVHAQPHLAKQMQEQTHNHINRALQLARQGQAGNAKMHLELAEQAMRTASQYMPEAEYAEFKEKVEERLQEVRKA